MKSKLSHEKSTHHTHNKVETAPHLTKFFKKFIKTEKGTVNVNIQEKANEKTENTKGRKRKRKRGERDARKSHRTNAKRETKERGKDANKKQENEC